MEANFAIYSLLDISRSLTYALSLLLASLVIYRANHLLPVGEKLETITGDLGAVDPATFQTIIETLALGGPALSESDDTRDMITSMIGQLASFLEGTDGSPEQRSFALYLLELSAANWVIGADEE
jgi:hypothetical protein